MQFAYRLGKNVCLAAALAVGVLLTAGCGAKTDSPLLGTFRMGEKVQAGPLTYTVLEAHSRPALSDTALGNPPQNRYLFVKVSITNSGNRATPVPAFELVGNQQTYHEVTEGLQDVPDALGVLRSVQPAQTEQGSVIFDAPVGAYKFAISDGGEPGSEKYAHVDIPVQLE
jgi:hypothetical protein